MPEEVKQEVVQKTQKYLGKYVKKPPLSDKLLRKPPFRFLHDVINTVIKETGFLKGLFSDEELNSENVKERDAKVAFLSKLIDAVKAITNTDLAVRPSKIIAGLEPTETNLLLQAIGKALDKKIDSSLYINQLQSGQIINNEKSKKPKKTLDKNEKVKKSTKPVGGSEEKTRSTPRNNDKKVSNETPKSTNREKPKRATKESKSKTGSNEGKPRNKEKTTKKGKTKEESPKEVTHPAQKSNENLEVSVPSVDAVNEVKETNKENTNAAVEISAVEVNSNRSLPDETVRTEDVAKTVIDSSVNEASADNEPKKRSTSASRPKSARPRSGDRKEKPVSEENKEPIHIQSRPKSSLRPPSVRPSSARPGAPRLRPDSAFPVKEVVPMGKINVIVESFDKDVDEEETVIIQSNPEVVDEQNENVADVPGDNKGHLVEQILEQINESDNKSSATKSEEWQKDVFYGKESTSKETNNLRSLIQTLTKTANPLGKLLNYLHEDIDAMHAELELWTNTKRQLFDEIAKQKKISNEMNKPLVSQLEHLNQEIKKMEDEIVNTRSNILRNEIKIKELLAK